MNITEPAVSSAVRRIEQLEEQLSTNEVFRVRGLCHGSVLRTLMSQGCIVDKSCKFQWTMATVRIGYIAVD